MRRSARPSDPIDAMMMNAICAEPACFGIIRSDLNFSRLESVSMSQTQTRIDQLVKSHDIVLFMKGSASFPMCGFSGRAIQILKAVGVDTKGITTVNVLDDPEIRQGIKEYSNWPTIPQLYVKGQFIGGSDIMMEMYESGELQQIVGA
jgi:monothiol glutaredoxin